MLLMSSSAALAAPAPIRYGHGAGESSQTAFAKPTAQPKQFASLGKASRASEDRFFYPDEDVTSGAVLASEVPKQLAQLAPLSQIDEIPAVVSGNLPTIGFVSAEEYYSYAKIGTPYEINGVTYYPEENPHYDVRGTASWYGPDFHGGLTANGEIYDMMDFSAAHPTLPLPCYVLVTNETNGRQVVVRVNDRGPFKKDRVIDLSRAAAEKLDMVGNGTADVRVQYIGRAEKAGDAPLYNRASEDVIFAENVPPQREISRAPAARPAVRPASMDAHFIQIGSFASRANADSLLRQAASVSTDGDVVFANVNGAKRYRVVMGPFSSKSDADNTLVRLNQNGFDGLIIKNPT